MEKVNVNLGKRSYEIVIGSNILANVASYLPKKYSKIVVLSNDKIGPLYKDIVMESLKTVTHSVYYYEVKDGEEYKSIETVLPVYDFMVDKNIDRSSLVVSLGGGVICDMTGYIAATYMRGIDFIQIPTTLLAQVDASIGGKVAVNHKNGKNLIGAFYQPKLVFIDVNVLNTLDMREIKTGLAEIIKHGIIYDKEYFEYTEENAEKILALDTDTMIKLVKKSCKIKAKVVSEDEEERGIRAILNYGHTFGHVVESLTKYKTYRHGEAVVAGMMFAGYLAKELGIAGEKLIEKQISIFKKFEMDYLIPKYDVDKMFEILAHDKKVKDGNLVFILCSKVGKAEIVSVPKEMVEKVYREVEGKKVKGVIDIGTNTVRLFVAEVYGSQIINKYAKFMEITRLGEDVDKTRRLKDEAIDRNINVLKTFAEHARGYGVLELKAAATSASRDAENGNIFIERALSEAGVKIEIIEGEKEGSYAFNGVMTDSYEKEVVVIDIGGGSTEFILGTKDNIKFIKSLDMGSVRLRDKFFKNENYEDNLEKAKKWIFDTMKEVKILKEEEFDLVGVAGTITTQVSVALKVSKYNTDLIHKYKLSMNKIDKNLKKFMSKSLEERKKIKGLNPKRADVIVSGTFLLKCIMEYLGKEEIIVSENDILEGLMTAGERE